LIHGVISLKARERFSFSGNDIRIQHYRSSAR
jgi:hypothetical protein